MKNDVVVTGIGLMTALGSDKESSWQSIVAGRSGATHNQHFPSKMWPSQSICSVPDDSIQHYNRKDFDKLPRLVKFGIIVADSCLKDAQIEKPSEPFSKGRCGLVVGSGIGPVDPLELYAITDFSDDSKNLLVDLRNRSRFLNHPGTLGALIADEFKLFGSLATIHTACASSAQALGYAFRNIRHGVFDRCLVVGADSLAAPLHLSGFSLIGALSKRNNQPQEASRAFDRDRDGFVPGEGAAALYLETKESALRRGQRIYAEIGGYGESLSAYRITDLPPDGRGIYEAMRDALNEDDIQPQAVNYINAHGTSTELNDRIEILAIKRLFESEEVGAYIGSTKSQTGHLISAAGALEAAFCCLSLHHQVVPPSININMVEPQFNGIKFPLVGTKIASFEYALSNSIGFGGSNASMLFKKYRVTDGTR